MIPVKSKPNAMFRDVMFPRAFRHLFDDFFPEQGNQENNRGFFFQPGVDIMEHETSFDIQVSIPGMKKEDIKIETKGDEMIISGERLNQRKEEKSKVHYSEISYGSFARSFHLPENVQKDKIEATYEDGMLHIVLPKGESTLSKSISIR